jgi:endonuclease YncB( thermonuclease family)
MRINKMNFNVMFGTINQNLISNHAILVSMREKIRIPVLSAILLIIFSGASFAWEAKVVGVSDGDTITVFNGETQTKIRLHGIDCPEKSQGFGNKAKQFTSDLCFGKTVEVCPLDTDRYGRTVAVVKLKDGRELNQELIRGGMAWHYKRYSDDEAYVLAEKQARDAGVGLWQDHNPIPPWEYRRNGSGASVQNAQSQAQQSTGYHGNVRSGVFHRSACKDFNCKNCTASFTSREEAIAAGYRPCGGCRP